MPEVVSQLCGNIETE